MDGNDDDAREGAAKALHRVYFVLLRLSFLTRARVYLETEQSEKRGQYRI